MVAHQELFVDDRCNFGDMVDLKTEMNLQIARSGCNAPRAET